MKQFSRVKFVNGSKTHPKVAHGYYVATIPEHLSKNAANIIVLDQDLNAKRVKQVTLVDDVRERTDLEQQVIDAHTLKGSLVDAIMGIDVDEPIKELTYLTETHSEALMRGFNLAKDEHKQRLNDIDVLKNGDKVEVRAKMLGEWTPWRPDHTFIGMANNGYVVSLGCGDLQTYPQCRKQQPAQEILPPSAHFNGSTKFVVKETFGAWTKGDIVEYVKHEDEEPLKWWFKNTRLGSTQFAWIHYNNLIPLPKDF